MKPSLLVFFAPALLLGACSSTNEDAAVDGGSGEGGADAAPQVDAASEAAPHDASGDSAAC
ncbi:MAG: hypothetical protein ABIP39_12305, partial [Polyangiaceae bacterium]